MKILVRKDNGIGIHGVIAVYHVEEVREQEHQIHVCRKIQFVMKSKFSKKHAIKMLVRLEHGAGMLGVIVVYLVKVESE